MSTSASEYDATLSALHEKEKALKQSRQRLLREIKEIDYKLEQNRREYGKIVNKRCPVLNLPIELTCLIFQLFVSSHSLKEQDSESLDIDSASSVQLSELARNPPQPLPELVILHVCKRWRDVSLSYPQLWTRFCCVTDYVHSLRNSVDQLDAYIKRSDSQNLELFLNFREFHEPLDPSQREKEILFLLDMAMKEVQRWKIVTLVWVPWVNEAFQSHFADLKLASAPNLEYFKFVPWRDVTHPIQNRDSLSRSIHVSKPTIFQGGAPKLRYLSLDSPHFALPPLSNITTLRLEDVDYGNGPMIMMSFFWKTFLQILSIPSLVNLSLVGIPYLAPELNPPDVINMNNLKHLRYRNNEFMARLLPFIRAPLLETLTIRMEEKIRENEFELNRFDVTLEPYFFPSLETLVLIDFWFPFPSSAWRTVTLTQNVKDILIYQESSCSECFFGSLPQHRDFTCWPKLTSITGNIHNSSLSHNVIVDFLQFLYSRPHGDTLTLRLFEDTHSHWKKEFPVEYERIQTYCIVEELGDEEEEENVFMRTMWPPGVDCPDYAFNPDPFEDIYY